MHFSECMLLLRFTLIVSLDHIFIGPCKPLLWIKFKSYICLGQVTEISNSLPPSTTLYVTLPIFRALGKTIAHGMQSVIVPGSFDTDTNCIGENVFLYGFDVLRSLREELSLEQSSFSFFFDNLRFVKGIGISSVHVTSSPVWRHINNLKINLW